jgi:hypothetical protein
MHHRAIPGCRQGSVQMVRSYPRAIVRAMRFMEAKKFAAVNYKQEIVPNYCVVNLDQNGRRESPATLIQSLIMGNCFLDKLLIRPGDMGWHRSKNFVSARKLSNNFDRFSETRVHFLQV